MSSNLDKELSDFVIVYESHVIDKFGNDLYIFKVIDEASAKRLVDFLKPYDSVNTNFTYSKDAEHYLKVKSRHIKDFHQNMFTKGQTYKSILKLVHFEYLDKKGYYAKLSIVEEISSSSDLEDSAKH
jgi:hypothetical protein